MSTSAIRAGRAFVELFADDSMLVRGLKIAEARIRKFGTKIHNIGRRLATLGIGMSIPFVASVKSFADFDDTMRAIKAVTNATAEEFENLTQKAKDLGRTTSFTTKQVAESMLQLGRAGFSPTEIDDSIKSILNLARSTRTDLSEAAQIAAAALRSFDLEAQYMPQMCDIMTAAANRSSQTLEDLGFAMSYCAPIASQFGLSVGETCKMIGALSNYGIKASQAGTTLRRVLVNLADKRVQRQLQGFGIDVTDKKTGEMRNASEVLRDLGRAMQHLDPSKQIMLSKELFGVWAMAGGAKLTVAQFDELYDAIDKSLGLAERTAAEMDAGIGGSLRELWSAVETVGITIGEALAPPLQKIVDFWTQAVSGLVEYISKNKELIIQMVKVIAGVIGVGGALIALGSGMLLVSKLLVLMASTLSTFFTILFLPFNLLVKILNGILFAAASFISVFSGLAKAVMSVGATFFMIGKIAFSVFAGVMSVAVSSIAIVAKSLFVVAYGVIGAIGIIFKGVIMFISTLIPIVSILATLLYSLTAALVSGVILLINTLFPIIAAGLSAMLGALSFAWTVITAGLAAAFSAIFLVVKAAFISVGSAILAGLASVLSVLASIFVPIFMAVVGFLAMLVGAIVSVVMVIGSLIATALVAVAAWIGAAITAAITFFVTQFVAIVTVTAALIGHFIAALGAMIAGILSAMAPIIVVLLTIASAVAAVYTLVSMLGTIGNVLTTIFGKIVGVIGQCFSRIMDLIVGVIGYMVLALIDGLASIIGMAWGMVQRLGGVLAGAVGTAIEGIRSAFASAWNGMVALFSSVFNTLGEIVTAFGEFFLEVFVHIGSAVEWVREKFGRLCVYAQEAYGAIVTALGRGDIEAAIGVIWASLKLIWAQGALWLVNTWYWVVETLQTAWANCVFSISEILIKAWFGVQEFWTETVYTMSTIWTEFSTNVVSTWKTAEKAVAKGIGYLISKMEGLDTDTMLQTIEDDYNRKAQQRDTEKANKLSEIQTKRNEKVASLQADKDGTLGILRSDFEKQAGERKGQNTNKIAEREKELAEAKNAYWEAIERAKTAPVKPEEGKENDLVGQMVKKVREFSRGFNANIGDKVSITGSFSAAAIQAMGAGGGTLDRVAKATEKSEKHLEKIAKKEEKNKEAKKDEKRDADKKDTPEGEDAAAREMKIHTRLLRDISMKGGVFV